MAADPLRTNDATPLTNNAGPEPVLETARVPDDALETRDVVAVPASLATPNTIPSPAAAPEGAATMPPAMVAPAAPAAILPPSRSAPRRSSCSGLAPVSPGLAR